MCDAKARLCFMVHSQAANQVQPKANHAYLCLHSHKRSSVHAQHFQAPATCQSSAANKHARQKWLHMHPAASTTAAMHTDQSTCRALLQRIRSAAFAASKNSPNVSSDAAQLCSLACSQPGLSKLLPAAHSSPNEGGCSQLTEPSSQPVSTLQTGSSPACRARLAGAAAGCLSQAVQHSTRGLDAGRTSTHPQKLRLTALHS